jgi:hypothetical protein
VQKRDLEGACALNALSYAPNDSRTWRATRKLLYFDSEDTHDNTSIDALILDDDETVYDKEDIRDGVHKYFANTQSLDHPHEAFDEVFYNESKQLVQNLLNSIPNTNADILKIPVTVQEVQRALAKLPKNSQPGVDQLPYEALIAGGLALHHSLSELMTSIQETMSMPDQ